MVQIYEATTRQDGRVVLDTTVSNTMMASIGAMNGHEGDNGRVINFVAVGANNRPKNLEGMTIDLVGTDAAGKIKIGGYYQPINPEYGTFDFIMPGAFYQQTGDYSKAYFRVRNSDGQVVSTINVMFTVIAGVGIITSGDSQIYDGYIEEQLAQVEEKVNQYTAATNKMISGNQSEVTAMRSIIDNMIDEINKHQVPTLAGDNHFTGNNVFDNLSSPALDGINTKFNAFSDSMTQKLSDSLPKYTDFWSRDYTWGPGLSKPNNGNDFALSRFQLNNNCFLIWGRGDVKVSHASGDQYWESTLTIPWNVNSASLYIADWHTYKGYFKPHHGADNSNTLAISCSGTGYNDETIALNLLIITQ